MPIASRNFSGCASSRSREEEEERPQRRRNPSSAASTPAARAPRRPWARAAAAAPGARRSAHFHRHDSPPDPGRVPSLEARELRQHDRDLLARGKERTFTAGEAAEGLLLRLLLRGGPGCFCRWRWGSLLPLSLAVGGRRCCRCCRWGRACCCCLVAAAAAALRTARPARPWRRRPGASPRPPPPRRAATKGSLLLLRRRCSRGSLSHSEPSLAGAFSQKKGRSFGPVRC